MPQTLLIILIPLLPLAGFFLNGLIAFQKARGMGFFGTPVISLIGCITPLASFVLGLALFWQFLGNPETAAFNAPELLDWMVLERLTLSFAFLVDRLSCLMILVVTGVGFLIHVYSVGYMRQDAGYARYMACLNLFVFFMLILVMADSLAFLFVGWEGVGLCSYLLIGFWYTDADKARAGKKAFVVNRIGDFGFLIGMFLIVALASSALGAEAMADDTAKNFLDFSFLKNNTRLLGPGITAITLCLFVGATGKSAQIPLYVWLPDAMAGPTPVSALIHAATMVTAGIYMIARLHFLFVLSPVTMNVIAAIGLLTALMAALIALTQHDIKKVLAYSTVSQLGFMFLGLGMGAFGAAPFHVLTHAFFKAGLFLGAGCVIHVLHHEQDIRFMGGLFKKMPVTAVTFLIFTLAISGIPPFAGFFSKDEILYMTYAHAPSPFYYWIALFTAGLTAVYMMRLFVYVFAGTCRFRHPETIHEAPAVMTLPLIFLAIGATASGFLGIPHHNLIGMWLKDLGQITPYHLEGSVLQESHLMLISSAWAIFLSGLTFLLYKNNLSFTEGLKHKLRNVYLLTFHKFRVDEVYEALFIKPLRVVSEKILDGFVDKIIIDGFLVQGTAVSARFLGQCFALLQTGLVGHYLLYLLLGLFFVMIYFVAV